MADTPAVLHRYGIQAEYDNLITKDDNSIYFISDTHRIYKGTKLIAEGNVEFVTDIPEFDVAEDNKLYIIDDGTNIALSIKGNSHMIDWSPYELFMATESNLGGIKAANRIATQTEEVGIDSTTGKLYVYAPVATNFTLPVDSWASNDTNTGYYIDILIPELHVTDRVSVEINQNSQTVARQCYMNPILQSMNGKFRIFAEKLPSAAINGQYWIEHGSQSI